MRVWLDRLDACLIAISLVLCIVGIVNAAIGIEPIEHAGVWFLWAYIAFERIKERNP